MGRGLSSLVGMLKLFSFSGVSGGAKKVSVLLPA